MRKAVLILVFISLTTLIYSQNERVKLGSVCYTESINGKNTNLNFEPYTYHKKIEFKFQSGYQITIKEETKGKLLEILKQYEDFHKKSVSANNNSPQLIDNFSPETISKGTKNIDPDKLIKVYYSMKLSEIPNSTGNLIIKIPELKDMFGSGTAPEHYIFISGNCVKDLIACLEK